MSSIALQQIQAMFAQAQLCHGIEGLRHIEQSIYDICNEHQFELPKAQYHFLIGLKHDRNDELDAAIEHYEACLNHCTSTDIVLRLHTHIVMGSIFADREDYQRAYQLYRVVLDNSHLLDDNYRSLAYTNISDFHLCLKQYESALSISSMGEECGRRIGNYVNQSICLLNMGYALGHMGQFEQALTDVESAKSIAQQIDNRRIEAIAFGYIAQIMALDTSRQPSQVIDNFEQADKLYQQVIDTHNRHENAVHFAAFLELHDHNEQALKICRSLEQEITAKGNYGFYALLCRTQIKLESKQHKTTNVVTLQKRLIDATDLAYAAAQTKEHSAILSNVERAKAEQERTLLAKMEEHIGLITEVGQYIATTDNLSDHLPSIFDKISQVFPTDEFGIALYDDTTHVLDYCYFYDHSGHVPSTQINCLTEHSIGTYVVKNRSTVHLNQINEQALDAFVPREIRQRRDKVNFDKSKPVQSIILTPITIGKRVLGVLSTQHKLTGQYQQHHLSLFEQLASFIAIALENHVQRQRLQLANQKLEVMSKTDPLTSLYNRYQLDDIAPQLTQVAASQHQPLAVVMIDIDFYKGFNDFHGHHQGDLALKQVAAQMRAVFNHQDDYLFRYGGDEFLVLCYGQTTEQLTSKISSLHKATKQLELINPLSQCHQYLTLSIGAANYTQMSGDNLSFEILFNLADKELYKVKEQGRNQFSIKSRTVESASPAI